MADLPISTDDYLAIFERTIDGFVRAIDGVDDDLLNRTPDLPNANSPAQIMVHALSAGRWWSEVIALGRPDTRDRAAEFEAVATGDELRQAAEATRTAMREMADDLAAATEVAVPEINELVPVDGGWTVGLAVMHGYEELAQHLGHLEITLDHLRANPELPPEGLELGVFSLSLAVKDLAASQAFYEKLGFAVTGGEEGSWAIMVNGRTVIGLFAGMFDQNILTFNPGWTGPGPGFAPDTFTDVRALRRHAIDAGLTVENDDSTTAEAEGPASFTLTDPDGNPILIDQHR